MFVNYLFHSLEQMKLICLILIEQLNGMTTTARIIVAKTE